MSAQPRGYHRLADFMGHYPESAIFRRFNSLNMLNLLSLQAELVDLQVQFRDLCAEDDVSSEGNEKDFSTYFRSLRKSEDSIQYEMLLDIRRKLQEYNAALIEASNVQRLPSPDSAHLQVLRDWLGGDGEGENFLRGNEEFTWNLPDDSPQREQRFLKKDLLTIHMSTTEQDIFSKLLSSSLLDLWSWLRSYRGPHRRGGASSTTEQQQQQQANDPDDTASSIEAILDPESSIQSYSEQVLLKVNNVLISVVGATMPVVAVVALYFIRTEGGRIGAMAAFTVLFALALAIFTNARRLEIAASTAA